MTDENRPITDADWDEIKEIMEMPYGHAKLMIDGFEVSLQQQIQKRKIVTVAYVNGKIKGCWMKASETGMAIHDEAKRFHRCRSRAVWPAQKVKEMQKIVGKRKAKKLADERIYWFDPVWKSARSLRKHLEANNKDIRVIKIIDGRPFRASAEFG